MTGTCITLGLAPQRLPARGNSALRVVAGAFTAGTSYITERDRQIEKRRALLRYLSNDDPYFLSLTCVPGTNESNFEVTAYHYSPSDRMSSSNLKLYTEECQRRLDVLYNSKAIMFKSLLQAEHDYGLSNLEIWDQRLLFKETLHFLCWGRNPFPRSFLD